MYNPGYILSGSSPTLAALTLTSNLTFGTAGSVLSGTTGSQGIMVTGTNQDFTITPSGTGSINLAIGNTPGYIKLNSHLFASTDATTNYLNSGSVSLNVRNAADSSNIFKLMNGGNLLLSGLTTDGTGVLQFPAATTSAGGITFGTDVNLYRESANNLTLNGPGSVTLNIRGFGSTSAGGNISYDSGTGGLAIISTNALRLYSSSSLALTLDASQNATFAANVVNSTSTKTGAGALAVTTTTSKYTTAGVADALTLADGVNGQLKEVILDVLTTGGDSAVLTPATKTGYTTITFSAAGQSATLRFVTTRGWIIMSLRGAVAA